MALDTKDVGSSPIVTEVSHLLGFQGNQLSRLPWESVLSAKIVNDISDITLPGIYRPGNAAALPNGHSLKYSVVLCLRAGVDLYLLAMSHEGSVAYAFKNNGTGFSGWHMLT